MAEPPPPSPDQKRQPVDGPQALLAATLDAIDGAQRDIVILSRALDPALYDEAPVSEHLFATIRRRRHSRIRILIADLQPLRLRGHRLLALAQRVPSFIEIRLLAQRHRAERREWLIADTQTVVFREQADKGQALSAHNDRRWALDLAHEFQAMWDMAEQHPDLRRLSL
ncbi:DUF7931 domain-containing protein [Acidihalobacter prosperus]|uniref:DUF7931 domain-containing protein n=1 Tax=Acidihalobacter prosperus TaxID=160660 RepID=A0A1A6C8X7_9GAMM|nr:hypothetical protein [Acidihalobacter prosperus]OBS11016.1 hypothetical protein Thpro_020732 [Acidihalobacter prosperus]